MRRLRRLRRLLPVVDLRLRDARLALTRLSLTRSTTFGFELRMVAELVVNLVDKPWRKLGRRRRIPGLRLRALEWRSGRVATNEAARGRTS